MGTDSAHGFTALFGYFFERWCARVAREAASMPAFTEHLLVPDMPGIDEVEDIVVINGSVVALLSVKSTLVREDQVKVAEYPFTG
jgi:hypothetical protein